MLFGGSGGTNLKAELGREGREGEGIVQSPSDYSISDVYRDITVDSMRADILLCCLAVLFRRGGVIACSDAPFCFLSQTFLYRRIIEPGLLV